MSFMPCHLWALFDPAYFEKNDGASLPVLAVGLDWPGADFFFDLFFRGRCRKLAGVSFLAEKNAPARNARAEQQGLDAAKAFFRRQVGFLSAP